MTTEQTKKIIDAASKIALVTAPQYTSWIVIGKIVSELAPEIYEQIRKLIENREPTKEEADVLHAKIQALFHPESIT